MTWVQRLLCLLLLVTSAGAGYLFWDAHVFLTHLDARVNGPTGLIMRAEGIESKANATLINFDAASKTWADSSKTQASALTDLVTDAHGTLFQANTALQGISGVAVHASGTADAATSLLSSARATTDTLPPLIGDVRTAVEGLPPVEARATDALGSLDTFLKSEAVTGTAANLEATTANLAATTNDFQIRFHAILYPAPCKTFGCKMARLWPLLRDVPTMGEGLYWTRELIQNVKP